MNESTFRITSKTTVAASARNVRPPSYQCQAPGCGKQSDTIACPRHLAMLPLHVQGALTNALATGEPGSYGPAMQAAMNIWTTEPD
jgi:hypothetical protein